MLFERLEAVLQTKLVPTWLCRFNLQVMLIGFFHAAMVQHISLFVFVDLTYCNPVSINVGLELVRLCVYITIFLLIQRNLKIRRSLCAVFPDTSISSTLDAST